jgi:hypothetical protein
VTTTIKAVQGSPASLCQRCIPLACFRHLLPSLCWIAVLWGAACRRRKCVPASDRITIVLCFQLNPPEVWPTPSPTHTGQTDAHAVAKPE